MEGDKDSTLEANVVINVRNCEDLNEMDNRVQIYDINKVNIQKM